VKGVPNSKSSKHLRLRGAIHVYFKEKISDISTAQEKKNNPSVLYLHSNSTSKLPFANSACFSDLHLSVAPMTAVREADNRFVHKGKRICSVINKIADAENNLDSSAQLLHGEKYPDGA
jgi:hypothetical protein